MGSLSLLNATTWVGGTNFTTRMNSLELAASAEELEDTRFGTNGQPRRGRSRVGGLEDVEAELNGYWESAAGNSVDEAAFTRLGDRQVVTHSVDGAEGSTAYFYQGAAFSYELGDEVGTVLPFTLTMMSAAENGSPGAVRGQVAAAVQDVSALGAFGSPVDVGPVLAGEYLYAAFHVLSAGTSLAVKVESDDTSGFATPTDVAGATIGPLTTADGTWMLRVPGPVTDTWFRFNVTAVTGTFSVAGALGAR